MNSFDYEKKESDVEELKILMGKRMAWDLVGYFMEEKGTEDIPDLDDPNNEDLIKYAGRFNRSPEEIMDIIVSSINYEERDEKKPVTTYIENLIDKVHQKAINNSKRSR